MFRCAPFGTQTICTGGRPSSLQLGTPRRQRHTMRKSAIGGRHSAPASLREDGFTSPFSALFCEAQLPPACSGERGSHTRICSATARAGLPETSLHCAAHRPRACTFLALRKMRWGRRPKRQHSFPSCPTMELASSNHIAHVLNQLRHGQEGTRVAVIYTAVPAFVAYSELNGPGCLSTISFRPRSRAPRQGQTQTFFVQTCTALPELTFSRGRLWSSCELFLGLCCAFLPH